MFKGYTLLWREQSQTVYSLQTLTDTPKTADIEISLKSKRERGGVCGQFIQIFQKSL